MFSHVSSQQFSSIHKYIFIKSSHHRVSLFREAIVRQGRVTGWGVWASLRLGETVAADGGCYRGCYGPPEIMAQYSDESSCPHYLLLLVNMDSLFLSQMYNSDEYLWDFRNKYNKVLKCSYCMHPWQRSPESASTRGCVTLLRLSSASASGLRHIGHRGRGGGGL